MNFLEQPGTVQTYGRLSSCAIICMLKDFLCKKVAPHLKYDFDMINIADGTEVFILLTCHIGMIARLSEYENVCEAPFDRCSS